MKNFQLFPPSRLDPEYPAWIWFAGIASIVGGIVAGCLVLYLLSIHYSASGVIFYLLMSVLLPVCGHGLLNLRPWARNLLTLVTAAVLVVTFSSGIHRFAFAPFHAGRQVPRGFLDVVVIYGWLAANAYVLGRLLLSRGGRSPFHAGEADEPSASRSGPLYYYLFVVLWYGILLLAVLHHFGVIALPLWAAQ